MARRSRLLKRIAETGPCWRCGPKGGLFVDDHGTRCRCLRGKLLAIADGRRNARVCITEGSQADDVPKV
jgi:hypothetical protein